MIETIIVIALLILFIREPGCGLAVLGVLALVGACIWYFAIQVPADKRRQEEEREERARSAVTVVVRYDRDSCPDRGFPLQVKIRNGSDRVLASVEWDLAATEPGHSSNLLEGEPGYISDRILPVRWSFVECYGMPERVRRRRDAARLVYEGRVGVVGWR